MKLHIAAVHTPSGIRALMAARTEEQVVRRVAGYVRRNADPLLWPADSEQVHVLLGQGRLKEAIELYFSRVGDRWDRESLHTAVVRLDAEPPDPTTGASVISGNGCDVRAVR